MVARESATAKRSWRALIAFVPIIGLLFFFWLALQTTIIKSPTADEGMHLLRGRVLWQTGDLTLQGEHMPLSHRIIGGFLLLEPTLPDVTQLPSWPKKAPIELVQEFLWQSDVNVGRTLFLGRLPIIFMGMLFGSFLAWWSRSKIGLLGQAITVVLFAFSPNYLASSTLATTDAIAAAAFVVAITVVWYFWESPGWWRWLWAALALGFALGSKLSGIVILPSVLVISYLQKRELPWWKPGLMILSMLPIAGLVVWLIYGFELGQIPRISLPIPAATYLNSVLTLTKHMEGGQIAYLLGERSFEGWFHYFGFAFLIKTPAVTLLLFILAVFYIVWRRRWKETLYLWLPALFFFAAASYSRFNIGYRHILPIIPLIWLLIAETAPFWRRRRQLTLLMIIALLLYSAISLIQRPHYLSFFNQFVGGSTQGYRYLGDSNIDWGQDLHLLAEYAEKYEAKKLYISYFGAADPAYYGLDKPPLFDETGNPSGFAPANPSPGRYAISVNHIQGPTTAEPDLFEYFRGREPIDRLGYSILIYDVPMAHDGAWIGHCLDPVPLLDEPEATQLVGQETLRHVYFDCRTSWVIPAGNDPGWYILPEDLNPNTISDHLADKSNLVYSNLQSSRYPAYRVYHWSGAGDVVKQMTSETKIISSSDDQALELPLAIEGTAQFMGGLVNGPVWGSVWSAEALTETPLSVLMHLYAGEPTPIVADGLGYPGIQWQPGDIFIQYADFGGSGGQFLETGLYNFATGERLTFDDGGETVRIYSATTE